MKLVARARRCAAVCGAVLVISGCSNPGDGSGGGRTGGGSGAGNQAGSNAAGAGSGAAGTGFGNSGGMGGSGGSGVVPVTSDGGGECGATSMTAEQIVVEEQIEVTEEITTVEPVAIYIMLDQSGSMVPLWPGALAGINAFVADPMSSGVDVALEFFPSVFLDPTPGACDGTGYDTPHVPMGRLPGHATMISSALAALPLPFGAGTPIEGALRGMTSFCEQFETTNPDEACVAVLVTDGSPSGCNQDLNALEEIVAVGSTAGVTTYAVGLLGSDFAFLDQLSMAGGAEDCDAAAATYACDVTAGANLLVNALNKIRDSVTTVQTRTETVTTIVETPLPCEWEIPEAPENQSFDREKVNVQLKAPSIGTATLGMVADADDCAANGWHYDDAAAPTRIIACPQTCELIEATTAATVDILLGCETIVLE